MNSEERRLLSEFLDQLAQVKGVAKDPDADGLIAQAAAKQPDACYLLVQKALLQEQALNNARAQIADLRNQLAQAQARPAPAPTRSGGFLGGGDPWASAAPRPAAPASSWGAPAAPQAGSGGGGLGGFLGTAAATAAGIAGGAFLFQGLENLFGGHHNSGNGFFDTAGVDNDERVENVTINEYYGNDDNAPDSNGFLDSGFDLQDDGFDAYNDDDDDSLSV
ncbi:hypothetical protein SAMN02949497_1338 [Methylomagnum ishizawai]|uniref:DUF2076 domain-containing protein n=1 Tax=Methylomagnum ishizawai TaxID=1760988 RepID=A0A1Y6CUS4_9GAMM|nr:DUF2076 family protein [Methylomagnum ishizawai]SMF94036.1 hypothetical protein SAMN02949497_1338 [Methylomagnum ishizawai]